MQSTTAKCGILEKKQKTNKSIRWKSNWITIENKKQRGYFPKD